MKFIKEIEKNLNMKSKINFLPLQKGDVKETMCNTNKLKKYINFSSETNYKTGIKNFISWYRLYHS